MFDLPDASNNTFYIVKNEIGWVQGRDIGWTNFGVCDVEEVEDEKFTPFFGNFVNMSETAEKRNYGWDAWTW